MSATNKTPNFDLPLFIGSDVPSWLGDWNGAMSDIDTDLATIKAAADGAVSTSENVEKQLAPINQSILNIQNSVTNLGQTTTLLSKQFRYSSLIPTSVLIPNTNFTMPKDGLLRLVISGLGHATVNVSGVNVFTVTSAASQTYIHSAWVFKGDVITYTFSSGASANIYYYPVNY